MNRRFRFLLFLAPVALAFALGGWASTVQSDTPSMDWDISGAAQGGPPPRSASSTAQSGPFCSTAGPLHVCLTTDKQLYAVGEPVHLALEITTDEPVSGYYPDTCPAFDFFVTTESGLGELWSLWDWWYHHMACLQVILPFALEPGQSLRYEAVWNQRDNLGSPVPPGNYLAWGQGGFCLDFLSPPCDPTSAPAAITIVATNTPSPTPAATPSPTPTATPFGAELCLFGDAVRGTQLTVDVPNQAYRFVGPGFDTGERSDPLLLRTLASGRIVLLDSVRDGGLLMVSGDGRCPAGPGTFRAIEITVAPLHFRRLLLNDPGP